MFVTNSPSRALEEEEEAAEEDGHSQFTKDEIGI